MHTFKLIFCDLILKLLSIRLSRFAIDVLPYVFYTYKLLNSFLIPNEKGIAIFPIPIVKIVHLPSVLRRENSKSCEISHFPALKQTVKVQFSLDVLEKFNLLKTLSTLR